MFSIIELIRAIIVTAAIGYIFSGSIKYNLTGDSKKDKLEGIKFSIFVAAPAVILHELAHKLVAISYGLNAEFFASYLGLGIGVLLKLISSPILIIVPGYVSISGASITQSSIIAFAGPLTNLLLWLIATLLLASKKRFSRKQLIILGYTKKINIILFFFNMIPFGPFDGAKVFNGLFSLLS